MQHGSKVGRWASQEGWPFGVAGSWLGARPCAGLAWRHRERLTEVQNDAHVQLHALPCAELKLHSPAIRKTEQPRWPLTDDATQFRLEGRARWITHNSLGMDRHRRSTGVRRIPRSATGADREMHRMLRRHALCCRPFSSQSAPHNSKVMKAHDNPASFSTFRCALFPT